MPQAPVDAVALEIWTGSWTQMLLLTLLLQEVPPLVPGHRLNDSAGTGFRALLGSSCDWVRALLTALTAFVACWAKVLRPVQVTQYSTDPARAPSWAARLIAP